MSFSGEVKEELAKHISSARHCQIAELAAILACCAAAVPDSDGAAAIEIRTENTVVLRKCFTLWRKTFNIDTDVFEKILKMPEKAGFYQVLLTDAQGAGKVLEACRWKMPGDDANPHLQTVSPLLIKNTCCRRAYLRGVYLSIGSMSNPRRSYHLEFVCASGQQAEQLCGVLTGFELEAKIIRRKKYYVVYIKEGACIVDLLNIMEAHVALMELENLRILKDIRGSVNRRVNCEAANIVKTVTAANRQVADIQLIQEKRGFSSLPENLRETAALRLEQPEATLSELSQMMNPPIGKSGINHRLRKLSEIADEIRTSTDGDHDGRKNMME